MFTVKIYRAGGVVVEKETITAGMVGWKIRLAFSPIWKRVAKWAYFRAGETTTEPVKIAGGDAVVEMEVPWEVLATAGEYLEIAIKGISGDGDTVIPTTYINLGMIQEGAGEEEGSEPSPTPLEALWLALGNLTELNTETKESLVVAINEVLAKANTGGSGEGGTGQSFKVGDGLKLDLETNTLFVDTASEVEADNTKPITSAAVYTTVGNIEVLLSTI